MISLLGGDPDAIRDDAMFEWGGLKPGTKIEKNDPLFPRIEAE